MKKSLIFLFLLAVGGALSAQLKEEDRLWWVYFEDKGPTMLLPQDADLLGFAQGALERRAKAGVAFPMEEDYPVYGPYVQAVTPMVTQTRHSLRWFNAMSVEATSAQMEKVAALPFVDRVEPYEDLQVKMAGTEGFDQETKGGDSLEHARLFAHQCQMIGMKSAEAAGLSGKGLLIAVFDAGFTGANLHPAFLHMRERGKIKETRDFVSHDGDVYHGSAHGTAVLSCIGGMYQGQRLGAAVDADYLLARTEYNHKEVAAEEDNWMAAMEWADQKGAHIISSSLGYGKPRYVYGDMTGSKTLVTRAAAMAVRKGILVVNSAGNEGAGEFHYVTAPGDADSVLTVGASYPMVALKMPFSSVGPNANGVLKPEISAPGYVLAANKRGGYSPIGGTSFACPLMAGMAACLMQEYPSASNMEIKEMIIKAGRTYPYFDYGLGYGPFHIDRALKPVEAAVAPTFKVEELRDTTWIAIEPAVAYKDTVADKNGKPFYLRFVQPDGKLTSYRTFLIQKKLRFGIPPSQKTPGKLEAWFEGYHWK